MLTLDEMESTLQIEYELRLEALGEEGLRELLAADPTALSELTQGHFSDVDGRRIAEATLAELIVRKESDAVVSPVPFVPQPAWAQFFTLFWQPFR
jgi:hypothetical protein